MSNFTAAKIGGWFAKQKLTATQLNHLQEQLLKCPNFSDGSTHSLTMPLYVNSGSGSGALNLNCEGQLGANYGKPWFLGTALICGTHGDFRPQTWMWSPTGSLTLSKPGFHIFESLNGAGRVVTLDPPVALSGSQDGAFYVVRNGDSQYSLTAYAAVGGNIVVIAPNSSAVIAWGTRSDNTKAWRLLMRGT